MTLHPAIDSIDSGSSAFLRLRISQTVLLKDSTEDFVYNAEQIDLPRKFNTPSPIMCKGDYALCRSKTVYIGETPLVLECGATDLVIMDK
jgi:hypothetical protein